MPTIRKVKRDVFWTEHYRRTRKGMRPVVSHFKLREINAETVKAPTAGRRGTYRVSILKYGEKGQSGDGWIVGTRHEIEARSPEHAKEIAIQRYGDEALDIARKSIPSQKGFAESVEFEVEEQKRFGSPEKSVDMNLADMIGDRAIGWFLITNPRTSTGGARKPFTRRGALIGRYLRTGRDNKMRNLWIEVTNPSTFPMKWRQNKHEKKIHALLDKPRQTNEAFVIYRQVGKNTPQILAVTPAKAVSKTDKQGKKKSDKKIKEERAKSSKGAINKTNKMLDKFLKIGEDEAKGVITQRQEKRAYQKAVQEVASISARGLRAEQEADKHFKSWLNRPQNYWLRHKTQANTKRQRAIKEDFQSQFKSSYGKKGWKPQEPTIIKGLGPTRQPDARMFGVTKETKPSSKEFQNFLAAVHEYDKYKKRK